MSRVSTSINFPSGAGEAFNFYKSVFGGGFSSVRRWSELPEMPGRPPVKEEEKNYIVHIEPPIMDDHIIMGSGIPESMRSDLVVGNNVQIMLEPDTREEADRIFAALADGGNVQMPMAGMFWGGYYGALTDKYGIHWMLNVSQE
ncbi:MAG: VOC family protein [Actinobacteria bacterium]|nr:VOC family protein [Actinomycetota bacterium]